MLLRLCRAELAVARGDRRRALAEARGGLVELGRARDRMGGLELVCGTAIHGQQLGELAVRLVLDGPRRTARQLFGWLERTRAQVYRYEPMPAIDDPVLAEKVAELRSLRRAVQLERVAGRLGAAPGAAGRGAGAGGAAAGLVHDPVGQAAPGRVARRGARRAR